MKETLRFNWQLLMGYYAYRNIKDNTNRNIKFKDVDLLLTSLSDIAEKSNINVRMYEETGLPEDVIAQYSSIYMPATFKDGCKGFSVRPNVSALYIFEKFLAPIPNKYFYWLAMAYDEINS